MNVTILSLFPEWFVGPLGDSIMGRARESGLLSIEVANFRDWATNRHQSVDDAPFGGGAGAVLRADVLAAALDALVGKPGTPGRARTIYMSPRGRRLDQEMARRLAREPAIAVVCGHYEAVDERLISSRIDEEVSLGDFVLTGGEIPAMALVDAVARMIPGVLGNEVSSETESFMDGLLEAPHYTRPRTFEGEDAPEVLLSGNHGGIETWREERALEITRARRPDLYAAQLLHPAQVRRLARRGRPFLLWRETAGARTPLLYPSWINPEDVWNPVEGKLRWQEGIAPGIRFTECGPADGRFCEELLEAIARYEGDAPLPAHFSPEALTLARNLVRASGITGTQATDTK